MAKKYYIIGIILFVFPILYYLAKGMMPTQEELDYRAAVEVYEGERSQDVERRMKKSPGQFSAEVTEELNKQLLWMSDFEHALCTYYLEEAEGKKGYVYVASSGQILGSYEVTLSVLGVCYDLFCFCFSVQKRESCDMESDFVCLYLCGSYDAS